MPRPERAKATSGALISTAALKAFMNRKYFPVLFGRNQTEIRRWQRTLGLLRSRRSMMRMILLSRGMENIFFIDSFCIQLLDTFICIVQIKIKPQ